MHVAQAALAAARRGEVGVRYAELGPVTYVLSGLGPGADPCAARPCRRNHWGIVLNGSLAIEQAGTRTELPSRSVFHVPGGTPAHRIAALTPAQVAGFEPAADRLPLDPSADASHGSTDEPTTSAVPITAFGVTARARVEDGAVAATGMTMGSLVLCAASLGAGAGYTEDWCDLPHWGLVVSGSIAIEWEDDVEIVAAGEVYACPSGPPGHRFQAADPAAILDFTPVEAMGRTSRVISWRRGLVAGARRVRRGPRLVPLP